MNINYMFLLGICILVLFLCTNFKLNKNNNNKLNNNKLNNNNKLKYLICDKYKNKPNHVFTNILEQNNYERTNSSDWNIYFPCGYNLNELETTKLNNNFSIDFKDKYIFAINGSDQVVGKIKLWNHMNKFYKPEIVKKIIPESYDFNSKSQKLLFEKNYKSGEIYVIKSKMQRQLGIKITDNLQEIKKNYNIQNILVQHFIKNQLLINNYHFNIRVFVLVVFKNRNMDIYLYNEGNIRYASKEFKKNSLDNQSLITKGVSAQKNIYNDKPILISDFKLYLKKIGFNYDQIHSNIKNSLILIFNCLYYQIGKHKRIQEGTNFQLFGGDYMVDDELKTYFLEFNKGPELGCPLGLNQECKMKQILQKDILKLIGIDKTKFNSPYQFEKIFSKNK
jgi:hypothetical protein